MPCVAYQSAAALISGASVFSSAACASQLTPVGNNRAPGSGNPAYTAALRLSTNVHRFLRDREFHLI